MRLNCGDTCPKTGSYKVINEQGRVVNTVYVGEGETMPPTQYQGCHYESVYYISYIYLLITPGIFHCCGTYL